MNFGLKALACLLLYPDAALKDNLPEIKEGVGGSSLSDDILFAKRLCLDIRYREAGEP